MVCKKFEGMKKIKIKGKLIEVKADHAKDLVKKIFGLILEQKIYPLLFEFSYERTWNFHTFLVLKPIDFVFINKKKKIVDIKLHVKPFRIGIKPKIPVKYVLELPDGMGNLFKIGETLEIQTTKAS